MKFMAVTIPMHVMARSKGRRSSSARVHTMAIRQHSKNARKAIRPPKVTIATVMLFCVDQWLHHGLGYAMNPTNDIRADA